MAKNKKTDNLVALYTVEYRTWISALHRCHNKDHASYPDYGGRGITVCDAWRDLDYGFAHFIADLGPKPGAELSLERVDNEKGYSPDNCIWADRKTQQNNRRSHRKSKDYGLGSYRGSPYIEHNGEIKTLFQWAEFAGINAFTLRQRLKRGMTMADALADLNYRLLNAKNGKRKVKLLTRELLIKRSNDNA